MISTTSSVCPVLAKASSKFFHSNLLLAVLVHKCPAIVLISSSQRLYCLPLFLFLSLGYQNKIVLFHFSVPLIICPVHFHLSVLIVVVTSVIFVIHHMVLWRFFCCFLIFSILRSIVRSQV